MHKKILLFAIGLLSTAYATCSNDSECATSSLCVRSVCLSPSQLVYLAETYAPVESVHRVSKQFTSPECTLAFECDTGFDRCSSGACLSDETFSNYRKEVQASYIKNFGGEKVEIQAKKCVSNIQCTPGDMCYNGVCQEYGKAMDEIKQKHS